MRLRLIVALTLAVFFMGACSAQSLSRPRHRFIDEDYNLFYMNLRAMRWRP